MVQIGLHFNCYGMFDSKGIIGFIVSAGNITFGVVMLSNVALIVGIVSGLSVTIDHIIGSVIKVKNYKKGKDVDGIIQ